MNDTVRDPMKEQSTPVMDNSDAAPSPADASEASPAPIAGGIPSTDSPAAAPASSSPESQQRRRGAVSLLVDILAAPVDAFRYLSAQLHVGLALVVAVASTLTLSAQPTLFPFAEEALGLETETSFAVPLIVSLLTFVLVAALYHVVARLLGGRNGFVYILQAVAFSSLPDVLAAPFYVLHRVVDIPGLVSLVSIGTNVWTIILSVIALREVYGFSTARAVAAFLISFVILFMPLVLLFMFVFGALLLGA